MSFGSLVRQERLAKGLTLREMAKMIGVSPTYLSKFERDEFLPPAEHKGVHDRRTRHLAPGNGAA
jgi:transcriptional regulator with XRE-family HTH domain